MDDAVIGDHPFILGLFSTEGRSLLARRGAFSDLDRALVVADCVIRHHVHCDRFANVFTTIVNVDPRSAPMVAECVRNGVMGNCF